MATYTGSDRRLAYLFANGGGGECKVISGYYHDGDFYEDQSYTQIITGDTECLYIDLDTTTLYLFDGTDYVEVQGGGGSGGGLAVTEEVLQATEVTLTQWADPLSIPLTLADYVGFGVEITWQSGSSPVSYFVTEEQINGNSYVLIPSRNSSHTHNDLYIGYSNGNLNIYVSTNYSVTIHRVTGLKKANMHTYSTTEQVVGTWHNGKPLYEICTTFTRVVVNGEAYDRQFIQLPSADMEIKDAKVMDEANGYSHYCCSIGNSDVSGYVYLRNNSSVAIGIDSIIFRYTKTSD